MDTLKANASKVTSKAEQFLTGKPHQGNETSGEEPMSGGKGEGSLEDPYDQGNAEQPGRYASQNADNEAKGTGHNMQDTVKKPFQSSKNTAQDTSTPAQSKVEQPMQDTQGKIGDVKDEPSNIGETAQQSVGDKTGDVKNAPKSAADNVPGTKQANEVVSKPSDGETPVNKEVQGRGGEGVGKRSKGASSSQPSQGLYDVKTGSLGKFGSGAAGKGNPTDANNLRQSGGATLGSAGELRAAKTGTSAPSVAQAHGAATPTGDDPHVAKSSTQPGGQQPQGGGAQDAPQDFDDTSNFDAAKPGAGEKADHMMGKDRKPSGGDEDERAMTQGEAQKAKKGEKKNFLSKAMHKMKIGKH
ncbi:DNA helicase rad5 [Ascosphaera pollenicola]|nr:DNA helicase rad5 [Ascosphaera pollenicola]